MTFLMSAASGGHSAVVRVLLDLGASVNAAQASGGFTALLLASRDRHADVVDMLIHAGADVNATRASGLTALLLASQSGHTGAVKALLGWVVSFFRAPCKNFTFCATTVPGLMLKLARQRLE